MKQEEHYHVLTKHVGIFSTFISTPFFFIYYNCYFIILLSIHLYYFITCSHNIIIVYFILILNSEISFKPQEDLPRMKGAAFDVYYVS